MKPYFSDKVLLTASEEEIIYLRSAVANMVWKLKDSPKEREKFQKLDEDLIQIINCLPF